MASFSKELLSGCTDGRGIKLTSTTGAGSGTTIHTAHASATDEVWVYMVNSSASSVKVTCEHGGTTDPDDHIELTIQAEDGLVQVIPGLPLTNSLVLTAFASVADVVACYGYVNRIT